MCSQCSVGERKANECRTVQPIALKFDPVGLDYNQVAVNQKLCACNVLRSLLGAHNIKYTLSASEPKPCLLYTSRCV